MNAKEHFEIGFAYAEKDCIFDKEEGEEPAAIAIEAFNTAISLDPNYAEAYFHRGIVFFARRQYDKAIADIEAAIKINPDPEYRKELKYVKKQASRGFSIIGSIIGGIIGLSIGMMFSLSTVAFIISFLLGIVVIGFRRIRKPFMFVLRTIWSIIKSLIKR